jgi:hypothetical protein
MVAVLPGPHLRVAAVRVDREHGDPVLLGGRSEEHGAAAAVRADLDPRAGTLGGVLGQLLELSGQRPAGDVRSGWHRGVGGLEGCGVLEVDHALTSSI